MNRHCRVPCSDNSHDDSVPVLDRDTVSIQNLPIVPLNELGKGDEWVYRVYRPATLERSVIVENV